MRDMREKKAQIVKLRNSGMSYAKIGERVGLGGGMVRMHYLNCTKTAKAPRVSRVFYDQTKLTTVTRIGSNVPVEESLSLIWQRIEKRLTKEPNGCWLWNGWKYPFGYGGVSLSDKSYRVHRISYMYHKGPIEKGLFVCHACDVPACCNPDHLWLGTSLDNSRDCVMKGRAGFQRKRSRREIQLGAQSS